MLPIDAQLLRAIAPPVKGAAARRRQADIIDEVGAVLQPTLQRYDITTRPRIAHFLAQICHESDGFTTTAVYSDGSAHPGGAALGDVNPGDEPLHDGLRSSLAAACENWKRHDINPDADNDDLEAVTRKFSGGLNGLGSRRDYLNKAKAELARVEQLIRHGQQSDSRPVLARGSGGDAVGRAQTMLRQRGFDVATDQDFGPATELAVKTSQRAHGLKADGIVDAPTWDVLEQQIPASAADTIAAGPAASSAPAVVDGGPGPAGRLAVSAPSGGSVGASRPSPEFPLPDGYFFGPLEGPDNSISGEYPGEPPEWRDGLGRWQKALGLPVTKKWDDGKTPKAASVLQQQKLWKPAPNLGYGCIGPAEWDAVFREGWRLPKGWDAEKPKPGSKAFPLPPGYYYGPLDGPDNSISGEYPGEPPEWRDGLGRWQKALGLPVTKKWNDGKTRQAAIELQLDNGLPPTPGVGYGCIGKSEWDAVLKDGWRLPKGWNPAQVTAPLDASLLWSMVVPGGNARQREIIEEIGPVLQPILEDYDIDTYLRVAHFLAQICHESDQFKTTVEYSDGKYLDGRTDLGNVNPGDGPRFKGRGLLQLTGRNNYRDYGKALGVDLEADPGLAADPVLSLKLAAEYWKRNNINALADRDDIKAVTRAINGGYYGLEQRKAYLARAKALLAQRGWGGGPPPGTLPSVSGSPRDVASVQRPGVTDINDPDVAWRPGFDPESWKESWRNPLLADNPPGYSGGAGPERDAAWLEYLSEFPLSERGFLPNPGAVTDIGLKVLGHAATQLGVSYAWGGRGKTGPGRGTLVNDLGGAKAFRDDLRTGFDCSGLTYYAAFQTNGAEIGNWTGEQVRSGKLVDVSGTLRPGDFIYYGDGDAHHVGIYVRPGVILNAPQSGVPVQLDFRPNSVGNDRNEGLIRARRLRP